MGGVDYSTVPGGGHHHHHQGNPNWSQHGSNDSVARVSTLTQAEHAAAQSALSKLVPTGTVTPTVLAKVAVSTPKLPPLKNLQAGTGLVAGSGSDTYAGGVATAQHSLASFASDTVVGGSTGVRLASVGHTAAAFTLSSDTINVAGATAAAVKALDPTSGQHVTQTITLSDSTTVKITGVHSHHVIKPGH